MRTKNVETRSYTKDGVEFCRIRSGQNAEKDRYEPCKPGMKLK